MDVEEGVRPVRDRLGWLLKHARERFATLSGSVVEPCGVSGRELAVLTVLGSGQPPSQLEAAQRLAIDRTTMVALLDVLEGRGLVERRTDPIDRRRNIVVLTTRGQEALRCGSRATDEAEATFLAPLAAEDREAFRRMLRLVAGDDAREPTADP